VGVVTATIDGGKIQRIKVCIFVAFSEEEVEERYVRQGRRNPGDQRSLNATSGDTGAQADFCGKQMLPQAAQGRCKRDE
jgi:hypothetical protein